MANLFRPLSFVLGDAQEPQGYPTLGHVPRKALCLTNECVDSVGWKASQPVTRMTLAQRPMHPEGSLIYAGPAAEAAGPPPVTEGIRVTDQPAHPSRMANRLVCGE